MRITDIETIPVEIPVKPLDEEWGLSPYVAGIRLADLPASLSFEEALEENEDATTSGKKLLIRVETDDGVVGWGEMKVPTMELGATVVDELIAPELIGRKVSEIAGYVDAFRDFASTNYIDVTPFLGGAEIAMWDALGKTLGQPVHQLIGGKTRDTYPLAFCLGVLTPDESRKHARFAAEHGFSTLKTKASRYWDADVARIEAMDDAADGRLDFRLDPNQQWSVNDAVRVGGRLERAGIHLEYLEQPIRVDSFGHLKRLRERLTQPIAINEDAYFPHNVYQAVREDAIDAAVVDVVPAGGILGLKRLAGVAADANVPLAHHSNFDLGIKNAAKLHVLASTPAFDLPMDSVYYALEDHVLAEPLEIEDGEFVVPDRPGLAGHVDEEAVERYRID
jgi:L-alanine-DL-glutamate epimerase-like enolase superfamily enzyme